MSGVRRRYSFMRRRGSGKRKNWFEPSLSNSVWSRPAIAPEQVFGTVGSANQVPAFVIVHQLIAVPPAFSVHGFAIINRIPLVAGQFYLEVIGIVIRAQKDA